MLDRGVRRVVMKAGERGAFVFTAKKEAHCDRFDVPGIVDPIGAGDAFTAAMTHYLLRGTDLNVLNDAGNRWGSWVASQSGAMPALPQGVRAEIEAAIEQSA